MRCSESAEQHLRLISASTEVRRELFQWTYAPYEVSRSQEHSVSMSQEHSANARISDGDAAPLDTAGLRSWTQQIQAGTGNGTTLSVGENDDESQTA